MKPRIKSKHARRGRQIREVTAPYRARRTPNRYTKCRVLTGEELSELVARMIAAKEANDKALLRKLEQDFMRGWYGEIRA